MIGEPLNRNNKEAYVEVLEVLNNMDVKYVEKIPVKLRKFFYENASKEYKFELDKTIPFEEQKLSEGAINILAMLNYNYWCEDEEHKRYLLNKYNENEIKYQKMLIEKYSEDNLFKKEDKNNRNLPQKYEHPKWYTEILRFIKRILNKG